jgi:hypothetical protein
MGRQRWLRNLYRIQERGSFSIPSLLICFVTFMRELVLGDLLCGLFNSHIQPNEVSLYFKVRQLMEVNFP